MSTFRFEGIKYSSIKDSLSGIVKPLTAIIGGDEKIQLLKIIAGRYNLTCEGWINGKDISLKSTKKEIKQFSSYIERRQLHLPKITVKEIIKMSLRLRRKEKGEKMALNNILEVLELISLVDTKIYRLSLFHSKILSIAIELTRNTKFLFLDSFLDGLNGKEVRDLIDIFQKLISLNNDIFIILTIDEPSKKVLKKFNHIILFKERGLISFQGIFRDLENQFKKTTSIENILIFSTDLKPSIFTTTNERYLKIDKFYYPSLNRQFIFLFERHCKCFIRDWKSELLKICMSIFLGLMIGLVNIETSSSSLDDQYKSKSGALFFYSTSPFIMGMIGAIAQFYRNKELYFKEMKESYYGVFCFFVTKTMFELISCSYLPFIQVLVGYYIIGLDPEFSSYLMIGLLAFLCCICGNILGTFISSISPNISIAFSIAPLFLMPLMLVSGTFIATISSFLSWLKYISPIYYAYSGMFQVQFYESCDDPTSNNCLGYNSSDINEFYPTFSSGIDVVLMVTIYLVVWILGLITLGIRVKRYEKK